MCLSAYSLLASYQRLETIGEGERGKDESGMPVSRYFGSLRVRLRLSVDLSRAEFNKATAAPFLASPERQSEERLSSGCCSAHPLFCFFDGSISVFMGVFGIPASFFG